MKKLSSNDVLLLIGAGLLLLCFFYFMVFYENGATKEASLEGEQIERDDDKKVNALRESSKQQGNEIMKRDMESKDLIDAMADGYSINPHSGDTIYDDVQKPVGDDEQQPSLDDTSGEPKTVIVKEKVIVHYIEKPSASKEKEPLEQSDQSLNDEEKGRERGGFFGSTASHTNSAALPGALTITAVIHDDLLVKNGDPVDIRLTEEKEYQGKRIERSTFVTARAEVRGQRMALKVDKIPVSDGFIRVDMEAFDLDNLPGLRIPDNMGKDIQGDVINDAISETGRRVNVPILGRTGQRASRQVVNDRSVKVDRGYKIILRQVK